MKSGFVLILGRPNVGKSTILNHLLGKKVSIVSEKPQTTRNNIRGVYRDSDSEIVFIDTPGVHKAKEALGEVMNEMVLSHLRDIEAILLVVDASKKYGLGDEYILEQIKGKTCPIIVVFNKIDLVTAPMMEELKAKYQELLPHAIQIECVATEGFNLEEIIKTLKEVLPEGPAYYLGEGYTDKDEIFQIKEIIREKALHFLKQEVPHSVAVYIRNIDWESSPMEIDAQIIVEKESQKPIVIGENGRMIKRIGTAARSDIERLLKKHVQLNLVAKVDKDWKDNPAELKKYGYTKEG